MKIRNLLAVAGIALLCTSVSFGQAAWADGNTITTTACTQPGASLTAPATTAQTATCMVDGQTLLVANFSESLSIQVPNEISFNLIPNQLNPGNKPLTAITSWVLDPTYSEIWVDAYFKDATNSMLPSFPGTDTANGQMGGPIGSDAILADLAGSNRHAFLPVGSATVLLDPILYEPNIASVYQIKNIQLAGTTTLGGGANPAILPGTASNDYYGQDTEVVNLNIDFTPTSSLYGTIYPSNSGNWQGLVYVRAQAY